MWCSDGHHDVGQGRVEADDAEHDVAVVDQEQRLETNIEILTQLVTVVLRDTVDAVVRVLCLSKRTLRLQTVRIRRSSRSGTRVDEVYQ